jgi:hypothetical protein
LPDHAEWLELLFSSAATLFGHLLPGEVEQFSFECCPLVQEIRSAIYYLLFFGR